MRRAVLALILCLLLGFLTSTIIAWAAVLPFDTNEAQLLEFKTNGWYGAVDRSTTVTTVRVVERRYFPDGRDAPPPFGAGRSPGDPPDWLPLDESPQSSGVIYMRGAAAGWPMRSLHFYVAPHEQPLFVDWEIGRHGLLSGINLGGFVELDYANEDVELPIRPLFPGLFINSAIFAAGWVLVLAWLYYCLRSSANRLRARQRCICCKYDMRGNTAICPECGTDQSAPTPLVDRRALFVLWLAFIKTSLLVAGTAAAVYFWPAPDRLLRAAYAGDISAMQALLDDGADINQYYLKNVSANGDKYAATYTALRAAVAAGSIETVRWLIKHGASVNTRTSVVATPLGEAIANDDLEIAKLLLESGATVTSSPFLESGLVWWAAINGNPAFIDLLADYGVDYSSHSHTLSRIMRESVSQTSRAPTTQGTQHCVSLMIEMGCPISLDSYEWAIWACDADALQVLLQHAQEIPSAWKSSSREHTLLLEILDGKCSDELLRIALDAGHDVNTATPTGQTALAFAAEARPLSTVQLLLNYGANPNAATTQGRIPLYWAVISDDAEKIKLLLDAGADPSAITEENLSFASQEVRELIEAAR